MFYYIRKHWAINSLVFLLQILWAAILVWQNVLFMGIFQAVIDLNFRYFAVSLLVFFASDAIGSAINIARSWAKARAIRVMNNSVRQDLSASLVRKGHSAFHAHQTGEYLSWYSNNIKQIENMSWASFYNSISVAAQMIFSLIVLVYVHWSLLIFSIVSAVLVISAPKLFEKRVESVSEACAQEQGKAMAKLKDLLSGMDVLCFFGKKKQFLEGAAATSDQMEKPNAKLTFVQAYVSEGVSVVSNLCQLAILLLTGYLSISGTIIQSAFSSTCNLSNTVYQGLTTLGQLVLAIRASKPYFEKITVHAEKEQKNAEAPALPPVQQGITVENLSFSYEGKPVLENASFQFRKGGKYALTGPSGCGKSTLLKLVLGWLPEYTGCIAFDGQDAKSFSPDQLQQQMSYIEQDVFLFNTTIRENITLGQEFTQQQLDKALRDSALDNDLKNMPLGLDTPVGEDGSCLSGGQKQRVAIARALIHNRSILLVDEGTSALDQKNADIVEQSLLQNPDLTLILVSHHLTPDRKAQFDQVYCLEPVVAQ